MVSDRLRLFLSSTKRAWCERWSNTLPLGLNLLPKWIYVLLVTRLRRYIRLKRLTPIAWSPSFAAIIFSILHILLGNNVLLLNGILSSELLFLLEQLDMLDLFLLLLINVLIVWKLLLEGSCDCVLFTLIGFSVAGHDFVNTLFGLRHLHVLEIIDKICIIFIFLDRLMHARLHTLWFLWRTQEI